MSRFRHRHTMDALIQLTPMIDVMTVLLAVFMVTTPMMTNGIDLDLPSAGHSALNGTDHAIQISVNANGEYFLNEMKLNVDDVVKRAIAMRGENPQLSIMINGDKHADYGAVMVVMGKLKDSGFQRVGLRTKAEK